MNLSTLALWCTVLGLPVAIYTGWLTWRSATKPFEGNKVPRIITSVMNEKVLDIPWQTELDSVRMWEQKNGKNQQWFLRQASDGTFVIVSRLTGKCLEVQDHLAVDGAKIRQADYTGVPSQRWMITRRDDGSFRIHNTHSGKCLDVLGHQRGNGAVVGQWRCKADSNQYWRIEPPPA